MKAFEARERALSIFNSRIDKEYTLVKIEIEKEVEDGKLKTTYDGTLSDEVLLKLKEEGYEVRHYQSGMMEYSYEIKW